MRTFNAIEELATAVAKHITITNLGSDFSNYSSQDVVLQIVNDSIDNNYDYVLGQLQALPQHEPPP